MRSWTSDAPSSREETRVTRMRQIVTDSKMEKHPRRNIMCDFCMTEISSGYHLDPNFDLCCDCFLKIKNRTVNMKEIHILLQNVGDAMKSFGQDESSTLS
jgi:hypothetical protein